MKRTLLLIALAVLPGVTPSAQHVPLATTQSGFVRERLARIDRVFQQFIDENRLPGAVTLVLQDGKPVYEKAFGWSDKEAGRRMTTDSVFRIASQTKALTSVVILSLVEEGKIALGDPAGRYIPAFAKTSVAVPSDGDVKIVPAKRAITIRDLLTHTAGISYGTNSSVASEYESKGLGPAAGYGWYTADKDEPICTTMERLATLPFVSQPGEAWVYGYNTDVLGCIAERASGMPLDELIRARVTGPLGMKDTQFYLPAAQRERLATVYRADPTAQSRARRMVPKARVITSTARGRASQAVRGCCPRLVITPDFSK